MALLIVVVATPAIAGGEAAHWASDWRYDWRSWEQERALVAEDSEITLPADFFADQGGVGGYVEEGGWDGGGGVIVGPSGVGQAGAFAQARARVRVRVSVSAHGGGHGCGCR